MSDVEHLFMCLLVMVVGEREGREEENEILQNKKQKNHRLCSHLPRKPESSLREVEDKAERP